MVAWGARRRRAYAAMLIIFASSAATFSSSAVFFASSSMFFASSAATLASAGASYERRRRASHVPEQKSVGRKHASEAGSTAGAQALYVSAKAGLLCRTPQET